MPQSHIISSREDLVALYGEPGATSLAKESSALTPEYGRWLERATFFALASVGAGGLDCSPRGDPEGQLVRILDPQTLVIPDRCGNNRLDTLKNIVADPRIALMFFIPGINETLRINGRATISTDPALISLFSVDGKRPLSVLVVAVDAVYFQCARALVRSGMWDRAAFADRGDVPTAGQMTKSAAPDFDAEAYDAALVPRQKATLY